MRDAVIVDVVRTPSGKGKPGGALSQLHPVDLLAATLRELLARNEIDPALVEDVIGGCVTQAGAQAANITRSAVLAAGFPVSVPATTVDRQCGSSQQALHFAAHAVLAGAADVLIACGVESMSLAPLWSNVGDADPYGTGVADRFPGGLIQQGTAAELVAARWKLSREELDEYACASHQRAAAATADGVFAADLVAVPDCPLTQDETIRPGTTVEQLSRLKPSFADERMAQRFPEIDWRVTAGNSSPLTDGASAALVMSADAAARLGLRPRARVHTTAVAGDDPVLMLMGVLPATQKVLGRAGLSVRDIDAFEVNEAFACVPLAWRREFEVPEDKLNRHGGAIALGHPLGASGVRIASTLIETLERLDARFGLQTMCEAGGMANATIIERL
ncbi:thiolase family protein [Amycolatopsis acidiphila]|uniref:Thiolase family protein n=1 Tax=Amycolatopsis acidiphila TaxID=715473 RepID=A0A558ADQ1_9PSEU|nr:thiolase family protein [Amycolatopsis acidiphila]TVT22398.1 thiolase family protein [Amycolatopsis acidiphila]UIJ57597.1 thiolase family protein [Amycolatopsis acidiphila]GHG89714.1 acetyl-CoA acetyltransferase [Amycolatopsis acidiphila]